MNTHDTYNTPPTPATGNTFAAEHTAAKVTRQADQAIAAGKRLTQDAADSVQAGLDSLRETVPGVVHGMADGANELLHAGAEHASHASTVVRDKASQLQTQAETYVRAQPLKAVLFAAAAGAVLALMLGRSHRGR